MKSSLGACTFLFLSGLALGQSAPSFQAADVRTSVKSTVAYMRGGAMRGGRFQVRTASMLDLVSFAYSVDSRMVVGGPSWLGSDRFDIVAGAPLATKQDEAQLMLQSLLAERFNLKVQKDTKPMPAFVLALGKGKPKLKESSGDGPPSCQGEAQTAGADTGAFTVVHCRNMTMGRLAGDLRNITDGTYLPNPVIDETSLKGVFDFDLKWHARNQLAAAGGEATTIFDAVDKQLGLKLEPQQRPQEVVVIDSVNRNPTPNAADVLSKIPPAPPAEFEIATIRLSPANAPKRGVVQNGRVDLEGLTLKELILISWDLNNDQMIAGLPKFGDGRGFSITARAPIPEGATSETEVDEDTLRLMLQNLLGERFNLKTHMEERPVEGYVLSAVKPKLEKADPGNRTECKEGPGKDGKDPRNTNPILNRLMTCTNMTMSQFAEELPLRVNGYVRTAVLNTTELEGPFDFTISFSGVNLYRNSTPENPNGALSLADAVNKQLGLKLELEKRPMPVVVIDHVDELPTEN